MHSKSEREEILAEAVAGISRVALAIAPLSAEQQTRAFGAAERTYLKMLHDLGYGAVAAQKWVTTAMTQVRMTVGRQKQSTLAARTWLRTVGEELVRRESGAAGA